jgi:hypothetical protein
MAHTTAGSHVAASDWSLFLNLHMVSNARNVCHVGALSHKFISINHISYIVTGNMKKMEILKMTHNRLAELPASVGRSVNPDKLYLTYPDWTDSQVKLSEISFENVFIRKTSVTFSTEIKTKSDENVGITSTNVRPHFDVSNLSFKFRLSKLSYIS